MRFYKAEKPMNPKERVWPAIMIVPTTDAVEPLALALDAPKTSAYPFIDDWKGQFGLCLKYSNQLQHTSIGYIAADIRHQRFMWKIHNCG